MRDIEANYLREAIDSLNRNFEKLVALTRKYPVIVEFKDHYFVFSTREGLSQRIQKLEEEYALLQQQQQQQQQQQ